jgi:hypothetical protein
MSSTLAWSVQQVIPFKGLTAVAMENYSVIASGTISYIYRWTAPYTIENILVGGVCIWNGTEMSMSASFGIDDPVSAVGIDEDGDFWAACVSGAYYQFDSAGTILTSGILPVYTGQSPTIPVGPSSFLFQGGHVYVGYSMAPYSIELL